MELIYSIAKITTRPRVVDYSTGLRQRALVLASACLCAARRLGESRGNKLKSEAANRNGNMINQLRVLLLLHYCGAYKMRLPRGGRGGGNAPSERMGENPRASSRRAAAPLRRRIRSPEVTLRPIGRYDARRDMAAALSYY